ncbi:MAG: hypothetical protein NVS4B10_14660 [Myxococcales bacterium]
MSARRLFAAFLGAALCAGALPAAAQDDAKAPTAGEIDLSIELGKTVSLGVGMGTPITCADGSLVERTSDGRGLGLRGVKIGSTLCRLLTASFTTLRYRVKVIEKQPARPKR